jgi:hypothetical protein
MGDSPWIYYSSVKHLFAVGTALSQGQVDPPGDRKLLKVAQALQFPWALDLLASIGFRRKSGEGFLPHRSN